MRIQQRGPQRDAVLAFVLMIALGAAIPAALGWLTLAAYLVGVVAALTAAIIAARLISDG